MACRVQIAKNIENKVKELTNEVLDTNLNIAINKANEVNTMFKTKVVTFARIGNEVVREITIPDTLVDLYYNIETKNETASQESLFDVSTEPIFLSFKYLHLVNNRISRVYKRLGTIKKQREIFSDNKEKLLELTQLEKSLRESLESKNGLLEIKNQLEDQIPEQNLRLYIEKDWKRIEALKNSNDIDDINELKELLNFYENLDPFAPIYTNSKDIIHPFHNPSDLFNDRGQLKPEMRDIVDYYKKLSAAALELKAEISTKEINIIESVINSDDIIKGENNVMYAAELFKTEADINKLEQLFLPPSHSSRNGLLPKILEKRLLNSVNNYRKYSQSLTNDIDVIEKEVLKELKKEYGITNTSEIYSPFLAKDENGFLQTGLIRRFSIKLDKLLERQKNKWNRIRFQKIPNYTLQAQKTAQIKLKAEIFQWYRNNFHFMDIRKIQSLKDEFSDLILTDIETSVEYENELKQLLGENGYKEAVEQQRQRLKEFKIHSEVEQVRLENLFKEGEITQEQLDRYWYNFNRDHNPVNFLRTAEQHSEKGFIPNVYNYDKDVYVHLIPRKYQAKGTRYMQVTKEETGYYDKDFEKIDNNSVLKQFHEILLEFQQDFYNSLSLEDQQNFDPFSLPTYEKTFSELLTDKDLNLVARIWESIKYLLAKLKDSMREGIQNDLSFAYTDPITGKIEYSVSNSFLQSNKPEINRLFLVAKAKLKLLYNNDLPKTLNLNQVSSAVLQILAENIGINADLQSFKRRFGNVEKFAVEDILKSAITDTVVRNKTMDLAKVMKTSSHALALFKARQDILPFATVLKRYYENIDKPLTTKDAVPLKDQGDHIIKNGKRVRAISQFDSWFERNILGNYNKKTSLGKFINTKLENSTGSIKIDEFLHKMSKRLSNVTIADTADDKLVRELKALLKEEKLDVDTRTKIEKELKNLQKHFSLTQILMTTLSWIRFNGLAYNIGAAMTNYFEGNISLLTNLPNYVPEEDYWNAMRISRNSIFRTYRVLTNKKAKLEVSLARHLMENMDILQDAYNELQKASVKSRLDKFYKLNPKELTSRVEYAIQMPILITTLKSVKIKDKKEENEISIWEAMMKGAEEGNVGQLGSEYKTAQNIYNFEALSKEEQNNLKKENPNLSLDTYNKVKNITSQLIIRTQGDYSEIGGNLASDSVEGLVFMMFRRWLPMIANIQFKVEDLNIYSGQKEKGRKRSMTTAQGILQGATIGLITTSPVGAIFGAAIGGLAVKTIPYFRATKLVSNNLSLINELTLNVLKTFKTLAAIPINTVTGKYLVKSEFKNKKLKKLDENLKKSYSTVDYNNMQANIREISILLAMTSTILMAKALFKGDDDEENRFLNVLANKLMQLSDQTMVYSSPVTAYENAMDLAFVQHMKKIGKVVQNSISYLEGNDMILGGKNVRQSKLKNSLKKLAPAFLQNDLGLGSSMDRQFNKFWADKYFRSPEEKAKDEIKHLKAKYRKELLDSGMPAKEVEKAVRSKFRRKTKNHITENYTELLNRLDYN